MNATLQALRAIPELQTALQTNAPQGLPSALGNLYTQMSRTTDSVVPSTFLTALRQAFPQFAEQSRSGKGTGGFAMYAQQGEPDVCDACDTVELIRMSCRCRGMLGTAHERTAGRVYPGPLNRRLDPAPKVR